MSDELSPLATAINNYLRKTPGYLTHATGIAAAVAAHLASDAVVERLRRAASTFFVLHSTDDAEWHIIRTGVDDSAVERFSESNSGVDAYARCETLSAAQPSARRSASMREWARLERSVRSR